MTYAVCTVVCLGVCHFRSCSCAVMLLSLLLEALPVLFLCRVVVEYVVGSISGHAIVPCCCCWVCCWKHFRSCSCAVLLLSMLLQALPVMLLCRVVVEYVVGSTSGHALVPYCCWVCCWKHFRSCSCAVMLLSLLLEALRLITLFYNDDHFNNNDMMNFLLNCRRRNRVTLRRIPMNVSLSYSFCIRYLMNQYCVFGVLTYTAGWTIIIRRTYNFIKRHQQWWRPFGGGVHECVYMCRGITLLSVLR